MALPLASLIHTNYFESIFKATKSKSTCFRLKVDHDIELVVGIHIGTDIKKAENLSAVSHPANEDEELVFQVLCKRRRRGVSPGTIS